MSAQSLNTSTDTSQAIRNLQRYLRRLSFENEFYDRVPIDGIFDSATEAALKKYQSSVGIAPSGTADKETWDSLFAEYSRITAAERGLRGLFIFPQAPSDYAVSLGDTLTLVRIIQLLMLELSVSYDAFEDIVESGTFDESTKRATERFQEINGLPVTGTVDAITWNRLVREYSNLAKKEE